MYTEGIMKFWNKRSRSNKMIQNELIEIRTEKGTNEKACSKI